MALSPIAIRLTAVGEAAVAGAFGNIGTAAHRMGDAIASESGRSAASLSTTARAASSLTDRLGAIRNAAAGIAVGGAAAGALAEHLAGSFVEADRLGGKLESMMKGKGLEEGIGKVRELGNAIAGLTGGDDDEVSAAIAAAIASGRTAGLREYGIVIDAAGQAAIAAAGKISIQAKSQETLNQVLRAGGAAINNLKEGMDASTVAMGEMGVRWGNIEEGFGRGAAKVKGALYAGVLAPLFSILETNPGLQETAGGILSIGAAATSAVGGVLGLGSQAALTALAFPKIGAAATAAFTTVKVAASSTIPFLLGVARALAVPFAILAAGAAVGIAGYETLRAANIGGFGDTHKSTAEIMADTRKLLMGDPAADAAAATKAAMAALPAGMGLAGTGATDATAVAAAAATGTALPGLTDGQRKLEQQREEARRRAIEVRAADISGRAGLETEQIRAARTQQRENERAILERNLKAIEAMGLDSETANSERERLQKAFDRRQAALDAAADYAAKQVELQANIVRTAAEGGNVIAAKLQQKYELARAGIALAAAGSPGSPMGLLTAGGFRPQGLGGMALSGGGSSPMLAGADGFTGKAGDFTRMLTGGQTLRINDANARTRRLPDNKLEITITVDDLLNKLFGGLRR